MLREQSLSVKTGFIASWFMVIRIMTVSQTGLYDSQLFTKAQIGVMLCQIFYVFNFLNLI